MQFNKKTKNVDVKVGDRVMVYMPGVVKGKAWKFARPYHEPFRVIGVTPTNAEVKLVSKPDSGPIFVSLSRVRPCHPELPNLVWTGYEKKRGAGKPKPTSITTPATPEYSGPMTRSRAKQ